MLDIIKSRRSTRSYQVKPVEEEKLMKIIEAGRYAPSGGNNQSCHFMVVENKEILDHLVHLTTEAFSQMEETPGMYASLVSSIRKAKQGGYIFHYNAPVLIITANKENYGNNIADCACALENMMLEANALDLGSCWINQLKWLRDDPKVLAYLQSLGLKEDERVYGAVAIGYAATEDGLPVRKPLRRTGNPVTRL